MSGSPINAHWADMLDIPPSNPCFVFVIRAQGLDGGISTPSSSSSEGGPLPSSSLSSLSSNHLSSLSSTGRCSTCHLDDTFTTPLLSGALGTVVSAYRLSTCHRFFLNKDVPFSTLAFIFECHLELSSLGMTRWHPSCNLSGGNCCHSPSSSPPS